ncbi:hypothetical protein Tco_1488158 [Tanacetum coccineum]
MKESRSKGVKMKRMEKARENALDVEMQIISSENAQNHQETIFKELSLEEHGVIATKIKKKRLKMKIVLWLKHLMRKLYNLLGRVPNRCSVVRKDLGVVIVLGLIEF